VYCGDNSDANSHQGAQADYEMQIRYTTVDFLAFQHYFLSELMFTFFSFRMFKEKN